MAENQAPSTPSSTSTTTETSNTESTSNEVMEQVSDGLEDHAEAILADAGMPQKKDSKPTAKEVKKEEKKKLKALKLKVDGKEIEEALPFEIDDNPEIVDYLRKELQMSKMGQKRAQDHSHLQKDVAAFFEALKSDPFAVLSDPNIGIDVKKAIAQYIEKEVENSKKSPEQVEKEKLEGELKALKEEREKEKKDAQEKEFRRLEEKATEEYDRQISDALDKSTLPKNPYIIKKVAEYMLLGLQQGIDVTADDVIPLVQDEMKKELKDMFGVMPEEMVEAYLGKDTLSKLRKKNIAKAKAPTVNTKALDIGRVQEKKSDQPAQKTSYKNFFKI